jgi:G3E family GTPase
MVSRVALLIGVGDYDQTSFKKLHTPPNGVRALENVLSDPKVGHFDRVKTLLNPDFTTMQQEIEDLFFHACKTDLILLYFAGHGVKDENNKLYLTNRSTVKYESGELKKSTAIKADFVIEVMSNSLARRQVVILDSCFSGAFPDGLLAMDDGSIGVKNQFGGEGRAILTATSSTQYALEQEGEELSIYSKYLVEGLKTGAAAPDEKDTIAVIDLHEYIQSKIKAAAPAMKPEYYGFREAGKIVLAKASLGDPELKFRKKVERRVHDGKISGIGRRILAKEQSKLGISEKRGLEIIQEVLRPYEERQESIREYSEAFRQEIRIKFPLDAQVLEELREYQRVLTLRDEDICLIEEEIKKQINLASIKDAALTLQSILSKDTRKMIPVTIITGFLGSGKTTLINKIVASRSDLNFFIIPGEFGDIYLSDTPNVEISDYDVNTNDPLDDPFVDSLYKALEKENRPDHIIVETMGLADLLPLALSILGTELRDLLRLASILTIIDSENFSEDDLTGFNSESFVNQVIYGDILIINKVDSISKTNLNLLEASILEIKKDAKILYAEYGQVELPLISSLGWLELDEASALRGFSEAISLFVFESEKSFNLQKFQHFLENEFPVNVFQVAAILWFEVQLDKKHIFYMSGNRYQLDPLLWEGDRKNQMIFIGMDLDTQLLKAKLDDCLSITIDDLNHN